MIANLDSATVSPARTIAAVHKLRQVFTVRQQEKKDSVIGLADAFDAIPSTPFNQGLQKMRDHLHDCIKIAEKKKGFGICC